MSTFNGLLFNFNRIAMRPPPEPLRQALIKAADEALQQPVLSVTQKPSPPPGGTAHDFQSIGPYWWPDPTKPDGLPYVRRDGEVNPEFYGEPNDRPRLEKLATTATTLAMSALVEGDPKYANRIATLIKAWFLDPATKMNPHLLYAQAIPGVCTGRGIGIIDTRFFVELIDAAQVAQQFGNDMTSLRPWMGMYLQWMLTHPYGQKERGERNNHGTWFDTQAVAFAIFAGRPDIAQEILATVPENRIDRQIDPDGHQPHELSRTRTFTYSCVNLEALFWLARIGQHVGFDLWRHPLLRAAIDFLAGYADPATPWPLPELNPEPHLPLPRERLTPLLLQAAVAWNEPRYRELAAMSGGDDVLPRVCWV